MNQKIYIRNLRYDVQVSDLQTLCEYFGVVNYVALPKDPKTGEGRGFGFCKFVEEADALKAGEGLNGTEFQGRFLKAAPARPGPSEPEAESA